MIWFFVGLFAYLAIAGCMFGVCYMFDFELRKRKSNVDSPDCEGWVALSLAWVFSVWFVIPWFIVKFNH